MMTSFTFCAGDKFIIADNFYISNLLFDINCFVVLSKLRSNQWLLPRLLEAAAGCRMARMPAAAQELLQWGGGQRRRLQQLSPNWLNTSSNYILHVQLQSYSREKVRAQDPLSDTVPQCSFSMGAVEWSNIMGINHPGPGQARLHLASETAQQCPLH